MRMKEKWNVMAAVLLCLWATCAAAADVVRFNERSYVKGPVIRLAEVAQVEGDLAAKAGDIELGPAPAPAATRRLDTGFVLARMRAAGVDTSKLDLQGARSIEVKTLYKEVTREMVADSLRQYIESQMTWDPAQTEINVEITNDTMMLPEGDLTFQWRSGPDFRYVGPGVFRGQVIVDGQARQTVTCKANIESYAKVVAAANAIPKGKTISENDLRVETKPLSSVTGTFFMDTADAVGFIAARNIAPGEIVTKTSLTARTIVKRNQLVTIETRAGGLMIVSRARAMTDGAEGDSVTCCNVDSKESFRGTVQKDGTVMVQ